MFIATTCYDKEDFFGAFIKHFDRTIGLFRPNEKEREQFIKRYLENRGVDTLSEEIIHNFAVRTCWSTYTYIETVLDFMLRNSQGEPITDAMLIDSFDLYNNGEEVEKKDKDDAERVAYHEMGHYLIEYLCGNHPPFVTIVARGDYGGYTSSDLHEGHYNKTRQNCLDEICCFGGRAAEFVVYGEKGINSGLSSDIVMATKTARNMVCHLGMGKFLYAIGGLYEDKIPDEMLKEIDQILHEQYERAVKMLESNRKKLDVLTKELIKKKSLTDFEVEKILNKK